MKIIEYIRHPSKILLKLDNLNIIRLSDKKYIKIMYKLRMQKNLNLANPQTFNEKLQWLKLYDRKAIYTTMVDKYEVKKFVANIIGNEYIIPTIGIYDNWNQIDFNALPNQFVIKCTHDSGGVVICKDKTKFNFDEARKKIEKYLKRNYYLQNREWPYKNVKPRIIVEKYIEQGDFGELTDYKLMCFDGKVKIIFTCTDRYNGKGLKVTFFDTNWKKLPFKRHYPTSSDNIPKPNRLKDMLRLAEILSKGIKFVRIDFYEVNNRLFFGEYTFFPGNGMEEFTPEEWDYSLGKLIKLSKEDDNK